MNSLIESKSIILNTIRNRECLSFPKENKNNDFKNLILYFPMFPFDPPENIRKPLVF